MKKIDTLQRLNVRAGDTVKCEVSSGSPFTKGSAYAVGKGGIVNNHGYTQDITDSKFSIVSRAPRPWGELTEAEQNELAGHAARGGTIQLKMSDGDWVPAVRNPDWFDDQAYRKAPEVETVELFGRAYSVSWNFPHKSKLAENTHKITFTVTDGEPDLASVKMEKLK